MGLDATDDKEFEKSIVKEIARAVLTEKIAEGTFDIKKADDIDYVKSVLKDELK
jgi:hypothetical protein